MTPQRGLAKGTVAGAATSGSGDLLQRGRGGAGPLAAAAAAMGLPRKGMGMEEACHVCGWDGEEWVPFQLNALDAGRTQPVSRPF